jgi:hypothetical protein
MPPAEAEAPQPTSAWLKALRLRASSHPADLLAAGAVLISGVLLLHWLSRRTFWADEWGILLHRRGWSVGTFLDPAVEHLIALPILIYKVLLTTAGMDSPAPFQVVAVLIFLLSIVLLFLYVRARVGQWLALAAILPILFLGPSWDDLLFPFQMALTGSIACGLASLLCLDRHSRRGDAIATVLLTASLLFSNVGIPFVAGAVVEVGLGRRPFRRAYVPGVPTLLWLLWYLGWGHTAHTFISFHNAAHLPSYVLDGLSSSIAVLLGLNGSVGAQTTVLDWGRPLLVLAVAVAGWRLYRLGRPSNRTLAALAILLGFWSLTALNASIFGLPTVGRYQYIGVVLLVVVAAELMRGISVPRWALITILAVSGASTLSNFSTLRDAANGIAALSDAERGGLSALELARGRVRSDLDVHQINRGAFWGFQDPGSYFSAVDAYGSPAYSPAELAASSEGSRVTADQVLAGALGVTLTAAGGSGIGPCVIAPADPARAIPVPPQGLTLRARAGTVQARLRRYSSESFPVALGELPRGRTELLRIPSDRSSRPWALQLSGSGGEVSICTTPPATPS